MFTVPYFVILASPFYLKKKWARKQRAALYQQQPRVSCVPCPPMSSPGYTGSTGSSAAHVPMRSRSWEPMTQRRTSLKGRSEAETMGKKSQEEGKLFFLINLWMMFTDEGCVPLCYNVFLHFMPPPQTALDVQMSSRFYEVLSVHVSTYLLPLVWFLFLFLPERLTTTEDLLTLWFSTKVMN